MATKYAKWPQNIPNGHKIYQTATKYTKRPQNIPNSIKKAKCGYIKYTNILHCEALQKIYPNWDFWFENKICHLATLIDMKKKLALKESVELR
jgi:hypothetical protein